MATNIIVESNKIYEKSLKKIVGEQISLEMENIREFNSIIKTEDS